MKFILSFFTLTVLFLSSAPAFADLAAYSEKCHSLSELDFDVVKNECKCKATRESINPFIPIQLEWCHEGTIVFEFCEQGRRQGAGVTFLDGRCFCPALEKYAGPYLPRPSNIFQSSQLEATKRGLETARNSNFLVNCKRETEHLRGSLVQVSPKARSCAAGDPFLSEFGTVYKLYSALTIPYSPLWVDPKNHLSNLGKHADGEDQPGIQGDPTIAVAILGPKLSEFFGFIKPFESKTIGTLPSLEFLNHAIQRLNTSVLTNGNQSAHEPFGIQSEIAIQFYEAPSDTLVSNEVYLRHFADKKVPIASLPIHFLTDRLAAQGKQVAFMHDMGYHAAPLLLLPKPVLDGIASTAQDVVTFVDWIRKEKPQFANSPNGKQFLETAIWNKTKNLDEHSANFGVAWASRNSGHIRYNHPTGELQDLFGQISVSESLEGSMVTRRQLLERAIVPATYFAASSNTIKPEVKDPGIEEAKRYLSEFIEKMKATDLKFDTHSWVNFTLKDLSHTEERLIVPRIGFLENQVDELHKRN